MSKILVTGASGFLGRHVSRAAAMKGHTVIGIGHGGWARDAWRAWGLSEWHELDLSLAGLVAHAGAPDIVVHCAGSSSVGSSFQDPARDFKRTVVTTFDTLEFLRTHAPNAAFVLPSSGAVYGVAEKLPITEDSPRSPISPYAANKVIAEDLCRSYGRSFGLRVAIVRIFSAYGIELRKQLLWDACQKAEKGDFRFGGTGRETRDWVHAEDVAELLLMAGNHAVPAAAIVNGASGLGVTVEQILGHLFEALGADHEPEFTGTARAGDPRLVVGDCTRALGWGWSPQRAWRDGVREYARWFRAAVN